jgi:gamma-glutamyltranspeptidase/glutathione hydrolase
VRGLSPQAALDAPRLHCEGAAVALDARVAPATVAALRAMGHDVHLVEATGLGNPFGRPAAVWRDASGALVPASDARAGGVAVLD